MNNLENTILVHIGVLNGEKGVFNGKKSVLNGIKGVFPTLKALLYSHSRVSTASNSFFIKDNSKNTIRE